jgi:hypothetical protein
MKTMLYSSGKYAVTVLKNTLFIILFTLLIQCEPAEVKNKPVKKKEIEKIAFLSQSEREIGKAKLLNIKSKKSYSSFYKNESEVSEKRYFVEEINFDKNGNKIIHNTYRSSGQIDLQWKYEYDEAENLLSSLCLSGGVTKRAEKIYTFDENGNEVEMKDYLQKTKNYNRIVNEYNDAGLKTAATLYDPSENIVSKIKYSYVDRKLVSETYYNDKSEQSGEFQFMYDSLGNIIEEKKIAEGFRVKTKKYILDSLNNVISIDETYFRREFEYNSSGNIISEQSYDGKGNPQLKVVNKYDEKGLMIETIKYAGSGKPEIYIEYEYEFYE